MRNQNKGDKEKNISTAIVIRLCLLPILIMKTERKNELK